nr:hypothetical protein [Evansella caseinilytica]
MFQKIIFYLWNKHEATSHSSLRSCQLSHCAIARDGTWIDISEILEEEETMSGADAFFFSQRGVLFSESG